MLLTLTSTMKLLAAASRGMQKKRGSVGPNMYLLCCKITVEIISQCKYLILFYRVLEYMVLFKKIQVTLKSLKRVYLRSRHVRCAMHRSKPLKSV